MKKISFTVETEPCNGTVEMHTSSNTTVSGLH